MYLLLLEIQQMQLGTLLNEILGWSKLTTELCLKFSAGCAAKVDLSILKVSRTREYSFGKLPG